MLTEADIVEALRVCYDPELRINIVDLGRIHAVHVERDHLAPGIDARFHVTVDLLPHHEEPDVMLAAVVTNRLMGIREISRADVTFLRDSPWTPGRMTSAARRQLSQQRGLIQLGGSV